MINGNMFVDVQYQDKGYGTIIWEYIENKYEESYILKKVMKL